MVTDMALALAAWVRIAMKKKVTAATIMDAFWELLGRCAASRLETRYTVFATWLEILLNGYKTAGTMFTIATNTRWLGDATWEEKHLRMVVHGWKSQHVYQQLLQEFSSGELYEAGTGGLNPILLGRPNAKLRIQTKLGFLASVAHVTRFRDGSSHEGVSTKYHLVFHFLRYLLIRMPRSRCMSRRLVLVQWRVRRSDV